MLVAHHTLGARSSQRVRDTQTGDGEIAEFRLLIPE